MEKTTRQNLSNVLDRYFGKTAQQKANSNLSRHIEQLRRIPKPEAEKTANFLAAKMKNPNIPNTIRVDPDLINLLPEYSTRPGNVFGLNVSDDFIDLLRVTGNSAWVKSTDLTTANHPLIAPVAAYLRNTRLRHNAQSGIQYYIASHPKDKDPENKGMAYINELISQITGDKPLAADAKGIKVRFFDRIFTDYGDRQLIRYLYGWGLVPVNVHPESPEEAAKAAKIETDILLAAIATKTEFEDAMDAMKDSKGQIKPGAKGLYGYMDQAKDSSRTSTELHLSLEDFKSGVPYIKHLDIARKIANLFDNKLAANTPKGRPAPPRVFSIVLDQATSAGRQASSNRNGIIITGHSETETSLVDILTK